MKTEALKDILSNIKGLAYLFNLKFLPTHPKDTKLTTKQCDELASEIFSIHTELLKNLKEIPRNGH